MTGLGNASALGPADTGTGISLGDARLFRKNAQEVVEKVVSLPEHEGGILESGPV